MSSARSTISSSRRATACAVVVIAALTALPIAAGAQDGASVAIRALTSPGVEMASGSTFAVSFRVENSSTELIELRDAVAMPEGWRLIVGGSPFEVRPGGGATRLVSFHVPQNASAGRYALTYRVAETVSSGSATEEELNVTVLPAARLGLLDAGVPCSIIAGDTLRTGFTAVNRGNVASTVTLQTLSSESYETHVFPDSFELEPGAGRDVVVRVVAPSDVSSPVAHVLTVEAFVGAARATGEDAASAVSTSVQEVVPRVSGCPDRYKRLPSAFRVSWLDGPSASGAQLEFSGGGGLAERSSHDVDFLFRTAGPEYARVFRQEEWYALNLRGAGYQLRTGDGIFGLSHLTGWMRRGRGAALALTGERWSLSGAYFRSTVTRVPDEEASASVGWTAGERLGLSVNYVSRLDVDDHVVSLELDTKPWDATTLEVEYAVDGAGSEHGAYRVAVRSVLGETRLYVDRLAAGRLHAGPYCNEDYTTCTVGVPFFGGSSVNAFYRDYEDNGDCDADSSSVRERAWSIGIKNRVSSGFGASLDYRLVEREGESSSVPFEYSTETARASFEAAKGGATGSASLELGRLMDEPEAADVLRYGLGFTLRSGRTWKLSGRFQSALVGSPDPSNRTDVFSLSGELRPSDDLTLAASVKWREFIEQEVGIADEFSARIVYALPWSHSVVADARWLRTGNFDEGSLAARFAYEIPIELPVGRKTTVGCITGKVFDADVASREGCEDVVLRLSGVTAVTGRDGSFMFPSLEPGEYYLNVDPSSIGSDRVPACKLPCKVTVVGGKDVEFDVGLSRPGRIEGLVSNEPGDGGGPVPPLVLELSNGLELIRAMTCRDGSFCFDRLRPGRWTLAIQPDGLPRFRGLEQETFVLDVSPGATERVEALVVSGTAPIPVIDSGDLTALSQ